VLGGGTLRPPTPDANSWPFPTKKSRRGFVALTAVRRELLGRRKIRLAAEHVDSSLAPFVVLLENGEQLRSV
jgi:hypothetical protein